MTLTERGGVPIDSVAHRQAVAGSLVLTQPPRLVVHSIAIGHARVDPGRVINCRVRTTYGLAMLSPGATFGSRVEAPPVLGSSTRHAAHFLSPRKTS